MDKKTLSADRRAAHARSVTAKRKVKRWKAVFHRAHALVVLRTKQIRDLSGGAKKALTWELAQVGTTETPYGSNRGPLVSAWQKVFGIDGEPWCGAFQGNGLMRANVAVDRSIVYVPSIITNGKAALAGMRLVIPIAFARAGDLVCFDWNYDGVFDHVGMVRKDYDGKGTLYTVEGNTSFDTAGDQSNGGCVALKARAVTGGGNLTIVRPRYSS